MQDREGMQLAAGDVHRMRYLVVGYAGTPDAVGLAGIYDRWGAA